jgi:transposase-like protein
MAKQQRDPQREQSWREVIADFQRGGRTVREFCAQRRLRESAFHYWRRELQRRDAEPAVSSTPAFVPVTVIPATVEVRCPSGHVVTLPNAEIETLRCLFAALAPEASC